MKEETDTGHALSQLDEKIILRESRESIAANEKNGSHPEENKDDTQTKENTGYVWVYQEYEASEIGLERAIITRNKILAAHSVFPQFQTGEESDFSELIQQQHPDEKAQGRRQVQDIMQTQGGHWLYPPPLSASYEHAKDTTTARRSTCETTRMFSQRSSLTREYNPWGLIHDEEEYEDSLRFSLVSVEGTSPVSATLTDYAYQAEENVLVNLDQSSSSKGGIEMEEVGQGSEEIDITPILVRISHILNDQLSSFSEKDEERSPTSSVITDKKISSFADDEKLLTPMAEVHGALKATLDKNIGSPLNVRVVGDGDIVRMLVTPGLVDDNDYLKIGLDVVSKVLDTRTSEGTVDGELSHIKVIYESDIPTNSKDIPFEKVMNTVIQQLKAEKESPKGVQKEILPGDHSQDQIKKNEEKVPMVGADKEEKDSIPSKQIRRITAHSDSSCGTTQSKDKIQPQNIIGILELSGESSTYVGTGVEEVMNAIVQTLKANEEVLPKGYSIVEIKRTDKDDDTQHPKQADSVSETIAPIYGTEDVRESLKLINQKETKFLPEIDAISASQAPVKDSKMEAITPTSATMHSREALKVLKKEENGFKDNLQKPKFVPDIDAISTVQAPLKDLEREAITPTTATKHSREPLKVLKKEENGFENNLQKPKFVPDIDAISTVQAPVKDLEREAITPTTATKHSREVLKVLKKEENDFANNLQKPKFVPDINAISTVQAPVNDLEREACLSRSDADGIPYMTGLLRKQIDSVDQKLRDAYDSLERSEVERQRLVKKLGRLRLLDLRLEELQALKRIAEAPVPDVRDIQILDDVIQRLKKATI